ncbi:peptide-methionine (S)-S-oxide reductase MsrA [bacterium]|nr:peptide-methionine (S)-S-oxide reductase MsrA [bacterium]
MVAQIHIAVFGGGCFWCTEAVFKMLRGVISVAPGYVGGTKKNPSYSDVSSGVSGYVEVVRIEYNPEQVSFRNLLTVFFGSHDPTSVNRQGNDVGTQYRSVIFYTTPEQKKESEDFIQEINASHQDGKSLATEVGPLDTFYPAEEYHKDYYARNPDAPYCQIIINPKLEKVQKEFAALLKEKSARGG